MIPCIRSPKPTRNTHPEDMDARPHSGMRRVIAHSPSVIDRDRDRAYGYKIAFSMSAILRRTSARASLMSRPSASNDIPRKPCRGTREIRR